MRLLRSATGATVLLLALTLLGGGIWVVTAPSTPASTGERELRFEPSRIEKWLAEGKAVDPATPDIPDALPMADTALDRARRREQFVISLERLRYCGRRAAECRELWPEAATEDEGRALQREEVELHKERGALYTRLTNLAGQDPGFIVELVKSGHDLPERLTLMGLIAPDVNDEITTEDAPSGPLLTGLLALAAGDTEEKAHLAAFATRLTRANRDLGGVLITLMGDPDFHVRVHAAQALAALAQEGVLGAFLVERLTTLKLAAVRDDGGVLDHRVRGWALKILASLESDEADDFVLRQFELLESGQDFDRITAAAMAAPRLAARHERRLVIALQRAFELTVHHQIHYSLLQVAEHLPAERRAAFAQLAESRLPPVGQRVQIPRLTGHGHRHAPSRSFTGVSRWEFRDGSSNSGPRTRRN